MNPHSSKRTGDLLRRRPASGALFWVLRITLICLVSSKAPAQPRITGQPKNVSVLLGAKAQFTVSASGAGPLSYAWRFNGAPIAEGTNPTLTVTNVTTAAFGSYDVVIRDAAGETTSAPVQLLLARWTELVTFGRSDSTSSCASSGSWPEYLAGFLGVPLRKYASIGTLPPHSGAMQTEVRRYLASFRPTTNVLVAIWNGGVDLLNPFVDVSPEQAVAGQLATTKLLVEGGVHHILMPKLWPPEILPGWTEWFQFLTSEDVLQYDELLDNELNQLQTAHDVTFYRPDMFTFLTRVWQNPLAFGFRAPLGTDFSCDRMHFNSPVHRLNAQQHYLALTPPLTIKSAVRVSQSDLQLEWTGGAPPFRIERASDPASGRWVSISEPTYTSNAIVKSATDMEFFRVVRLGQ